MEEAVRTAGAASGAPAEGRGAPAAPAAPAVPAAPAPAPSIPRRGVRLANILTLSRIALAPVFVWAFLAGHGPGHLPWAQWTAFLVAVSFELTDAFDGWVARKRNEVSDFGKILDPVADSISRFTVFLCFLSVGYADVWSVAVIFWRDAVVGMLRVLSGQQGIVLAARTWGKAKAVVQAVAILSILAFGVVPVLRIGGWFVWSVHGPDHHAEVAQWILRCVAAVTAISLVDYLRGNREVLRRIEV
jgi:CDP-diacylglycerol--glycerol-3-phosphate 3-phosphatidyltransferase